MAETKTQAPVDAKVVFSSPVHFFAFGLGSGLAPRAPGTFGSLAALLLYPLLLLLPSNWYVPIVLIAAVLGVWLCGESAQRLGVHDHSGIVWDEFVGMWMTLWLAPVNILWWCVGFALFRLFDIWKPGPIGYADRHIGGGLGIMLDDILAGMLAWLCLQGLVGFWAWV